MAGKAKKTAAVAYLRTSSAANVGRDKDSDKRQRAAITAFAKSAGYEIVAEFYDQAVERHRSGRGAQRLRRHARADRRERHPHHTGRKS